MRKLVVYISLLFIPSMMIGKTKESLPEYFIGKTSPGKELKHTEALYIFTITDYGTPMKHQSVRMSYNGIEKTLSTDANGICSLKVKPGKYKFQLYVKEYYEITTDSIPVKPGFRLPIEFNFSSATHPVMVEKPVIYLYAQEPAAVHIKLEPKENFSFTYPVYNNGWSCTANTDGSIQVGEKKYPYLFWDAKVQLAEDAMSTKEGFMVKRENLLAFLEEKLTAMNMNEKEQADFITYWYPRMSSNAGCFVHFLFNQSTDVYAPMTVEPKPTHLFRVWMMWSPADGISAQPKAQAIPSIQRDGLSIVEWGGSELPAYRP